MWQNVCIDSVPDPFAVIGATTATMGIETKHPCVLTWADGTVDTYLDPASPPSAATAVSLYGGSTVDARATVYLLLALKGLVQPALIKEQDVDQGKTDAVLATTLFSGFTWCVIRRIEGAVIQRVRQNDGGSLPTTTSDGGTAQRGDSWYFDGTRWVLRHIGNAGDLYTTVGGLPVWQPFTLNGVPVTTTTVIQTSDNGVQGAKAIVITPGSPPLNWQLPAFDHTAWPLAIASVTHGFLIAATHEGPNGQVLFWVPFPLTAAQLANVALVIQDDSQYEAIYVNGQFLAGPSALIPNAMPPTTIPIPPGMLVPGQNYLAVWSINDADPGLDPLQAYGGIRYSIIQATSQIPPGAIGPGPLPPGVTGAAVAWAHNDAVVGMEPTGSFNDSASVQVTATHNAATGTVDYAFTVAGIGNVPITNAANTIAGTFHGGTITARVLIQSGSPPVNWDQPGFGDGGWPLAVHPVPGTGNNDYAVSTTQEGPFGVLLYRDHFTVDLSGGLDHVTLHIACDDHLTALSLNGVAQAIIPAANGAFVDYTFPRSALVSGINLLAMQNVNDSDSGSPTQQFGGVGYTVSTNSSSIPQGLTFPGGAPDGSVMVKIAGVWSFVAPGTTGQFFKMLGSGLPGWV